MTTPPSAPNQLQRFVDDSRKRRIARGSTVRRSTAGRVASVHAQPRHQRAERGALVFVLACVCMAIVSCAPAASEPHPMVGNSEFQVSSLSADTRVWYDRFLNALNNPKQYPNVKQAAAKGDLYQLGRYVATDITTTLTVFRLTGDLQLLDRVDEVMQIARNQLKDTNGDGIPNWRWLLDSNNSTYYGKDNHVMDELMTHGMIAEVAWAYQQNRTLTSPTGIDYGKRADFWLHYLKQWESKWRQRSNTPTAFPFIYKNIIHPYVNLIRYLWYMHRLTGDQDYLTEATRLANDLNKNELRPITTPNGPGLVFALGITKEEPDLDELNTVSYSEYTTQVLMDLALEPFTPFSAKTTLIPLANTIATKVIDNGSTDFARTIGGEKAIGGLRMPTGVDRTPTTRWAIYPVSEYAAYDKTNKIATTNEQVYNNIERNNLNNPTRIAIPAAMIINNLLPN